MLLGILREKWEAYRRLMAGRAERVPSRSKARRPKPTVKLELEGLTERILPSASAVAPLTAPPPIAATVSLPASPSAAVTSHSASTTGLGSHSIVVPSHGSGSGDSTTVSSVLSPSDIIYGSGSLIGSFTNY